jgi:hypothetical protein
MNLETLPESTHLLVQSCGQLLSYLLQHLTSWYQNFNWAAKTKYNSLNGLNNRLVFFPHSSRDRKFKIKVWYCPVSGGGYSPGLQIAGFLLCPHME